MVESRRSLQNLFADVALDHLMRLAARVDESAPRISDPSREPAPPGGFVLCRRGEAVMLFP